MAILEVVDAIGKRGTAAIAGAARFLCFLDDVLMAAVSDRGRGNRVLRKVFVHQVYFTGVEAIPMLTILAVIIGIATTFGILTALPAIGATEYIGPVVVGILMRELAPIVTAVIVIARSCTAIAAELSSMSITEEISAMKAMRINHFRLVVLPRLFGGVVAVVCLSSYFAVIAVMAGYGAASLLMDLPLETYLHDVVTAIRPMDIVVGLAKSVIFGAMIPLLACYYGLSAEYSSTQIPQMTTKATVRSLVWCFIAALLITLLTY